MVQQQCACRMHAVQANIKGTSIPHMLARHSGTAPGARRSGARWRGVSVVRRIVLQRPQMCVKRRCAARKPRDGMPVCHLFRLLLFMLPFACTIILNPRRPSVRPLVGVVVWWRAIASGGRYPMMTIIIHHCFQLIFIVHFITGFSYWFLSFFRFLLFTLICHSHYTLLLINIIV